MPHLPAFVTNFEILRSQDYVLLSFGTPTGEVEQGRMLTEELQKLALTHPRFLEFAAAIAKMADVMRASAPPRRTTSQAQRQERRANDPEPDDPPAGGDAQNAGLSAGRPIRH